VEKKLLRRPSCGCRKAVLGEEALEKEE